ncbi:preprotein translocase subunit YajC [Chitinimonas koreensis]|uniref:preprotein translocase subunit YajC n=1 Tax=Chitinimonas koreensis TaxID=356302 RepID=UPI0004025418|nr:preprotein translocase subunit YajC [Chitinimonas koreensis]QNM96101.1 preprotein translocase subunit YajC [Chitinimonas koreensis]
MLITPAYAAAPAQAGGLEMLTSIAPMIVIFVLFYFLMIRPQQKKMKEHRAMLDAVQKGDEVITNGGVLARVVKAGEAYLTLEVSDGVEIVVQRGAIAAKVDKGTIKAQR